MTSGGSRNRSGPAADPNSFRSEAKGLVLTALPSEGFQGEVPEFPGHVEADAFARTMAVWESLWRTPQAAAWAVQSWRWAHVADLARLMVLAEDPKTPVGVFTHLRQARADLGLTPAGLVENGWKIAADEVAERREEANAPAARRSARDRLRALNG